MNENTNLIDEHNEELTPIVELSPFKRMVLSLGTLPSSFYNTKTYYESLVYFYEYLKNEVIPSVNSNNQAVEELQTKYLELKDYVDNYFDNLDVQEEINQKLDEMTLDGTLTNLIKDYVDPIYEAYETEINNKLDAQDGEISNFKTSINNEISSFKTSVNNNITSMDNKIDNITSGAPAGVYTTVSALTTADPDHSKIYIVSADGHWYYYNTDISSWSDGGIYQSTSLGSNEVSFNNLTETLKDYKIINADNLMYMKHYSVYEGQLISQTNTVTSSAFILPKGNTISINTAFKGRITYYDINTKKYVGSTGGFSQITNYVANDDYIIRISFENIADASSTAITDGNSTNIIFEGIIPNNKLVQNIIDNLTVTRATVNSRAVSSKFYVGKGTKISILDQKLQWYYNNVWYDSNSLIKYAIRKSNTNTSIETVTELTSPTTINEDCFIEIAMQMINGRSLTETEASNLIKNNIIIDYVPYQNNKIISSVYTANNYNFEIIDSKFKLNSNLQIFNGYEVKSYSWSSLTSQFSSYVQNDYIALPNYSIFYYDVNTDSLEIAQYTNTSLKLSPQITPLLISGYNMIYSGLLYQRYIALSMLENKKNINHIFNSANYGEYSWNEKAFEYSQLLNINSNNIETFLFFTDPHITGASQTNDYFDEQYMQDQIAKLQKMYNSLPLNYIVCGGDWLNSDLQTYAIWKLGYINGFTNSMFKNFYNMVGNHDTNYQGYLTTESESYTGMISKESMINLWFRKYGQTYYKFKGLKSTNYVLDSGLDANWGGYWNKDMNMAKWNQLDWFANELLTDDPEHSTVYVHAVWLTSDTHTLSPLSDNATKIINAFNNHTTITLNDPNYAYTVTYNFTSCTGHIDYVLSGHTHEDYTATVNGVLCIATDRFLSGNVVTYDIVLNDYDNHKAYFIRVGSGTNREFNI